jgi:alkylation response protein AidB-like acyl-CoA dehydrogenase
MTAQVQDLLFTLAHIAEEPCDMDTAAAVLEEFARFCSEEIAPLNAPGDRAGSVLTDERVRTPPGFRDAYAKFAAMGWQGLSQPEAHGGQGLPRALGAAATEILNAANMSFALCPLLTDGAIEALSRFGDASVKALLPKLVSGDWTGTMNLTEPQAGSDLSLLRTKAERATDGTYRITGTKIFITYGEHDLAENILHLVLARVPGAPEGVKGISLFLVPKILANGRRNGLRAQSLEHKLGVRASPTCVMEFEGAEALLIGAENAGLEQMFAMMNAARFAVGVQGIAIAERACNQAIAYAHTRLQGRPVNGGPGPVAIVQHPDIRRILGQMRARTEGCRALAIFAASTAPDLADYLVPLVKGYATEMAVVTTSDAVQVHGGMGFIEETGVAQLYRDARILPIYEGTTAIQAGDLLGRKTLRDKGAMAVRLAARIAATEDALSAFPDIAGALGTARADFLTATDWLLNASPEAAHAGAVPYLILAGNLAAGWQMARAALAADPATPFGAAKIATARFYAAHLLPDTALCRARILQGAESLLALTF